jgi:hypothetical protein
MKSRNICTLFMIAAHTTTQANDFIIKPNEYRRQWSESSAPVIVTVSIIGSLVSAAVLLLSPPAHLTGQSLLFYKMFTYNMASIFIHGSVLFSILLCYAESNEDIIYYVKTHKDEVIKKLQQCTEEPKKINYRNSQIVMLVIPLLGILLSFTGVYAFGMYIGKIQDKSLYIK